METLDFDMVPIGGEDPPTSPQPVDELPEEYRGMTAAQLARDLQETKNLLSQAINRPTPQSMPTPAPQQVAPAEPEAWTADDLIDPSKLQAKVSNLMEHKAIPLLMQQQVLAAGMLRQQAKASLPYFDVVEQDIDQMIRQQNLTPAQLSNPMTWQFLHSQAVANNVEKVAEVKRKRPVPGHSERPAGGPSGPTETLSHEERRIAQALGVPEKEYLLYRKALQGGGA